MHFNYQSVIYITNGMQTQHLAKCHDLILDFQIQLDVLCLTETYCKPDNSVAVVDIWIHKGEHVYRCDRCGVGSSLELCANACEKWDLIGFVYNPLCKGDWHRGYITK